MKFKDYIKKAIVFENIDIESCRERYIASRRIQTLLSLFNYIELIDGVKKHVFYGTSPDELPFPDYHKYDKYTEEDQSSDMRSLHAIFGLLTETDELYGALLAQDKINIGEEIGDLMWYIAVLCDEHDINLEQVLDTNIKKLTSRYGQKFSQEKAENRDLHTEREILSAQVSHPEHYTYSEIQPIDVIDSWKLGFYTGNVIKYIARHEHKENPLRDLKKARWYLDKYIAMFEEEDEK